MDNSDKLCVDLCCGRKGFSRAFKEAGWRVVTVDIEPKFEPTICIDVRRLTWEDIAAATRASRASFDKVVVLASPPCERFSIAMPRWPQAGIGRGLEIVGACLEFIIDVKPEYWCLENPKGRLRWFLGAPPHSVKLSDYGHRLSTQGGKIRKALKPTDLWSNIPFKLVKASMDIEATKGATGFTPESRAIRAEMPLGLSQAILEAVEQS